MGWMIPVPVERTVPVGTALDLRSQSTISGSWRLSWPVLAEPLKTSRPSRSTRQ